MMAIPRLFEQLPKKFSKELARLKVQNFSDFKKQCAHQPAEDDFYQQDEGLRSLSGSDSDSMSSGSEYSDDKSLYGNDDIIFPVEPKRVYGKLLDTHSM